MNGIYQKFKDVCFVTAGGIIGLSFLPFTKEINKDWKYVLLTFFVLIFLGVGVLDGIGKIYVILRRKVNKSLKTIAVLTPFDLNKDTSSWIYISLVDISKQFKKKGIRHKYIKKIKDIKKFPIIINPYGGVYPEENISSLKSLDEIFYYVRDGGIFVNVADIPFYYAYEKNLKRRIDTTPFVNSMSLERGFLSSLLTQKLHVLVLGLIKSPFKNVTRIISLEGNSKNYYQKKIPHGGKNFSPYLAIPYVSGYFLFSTVEIKTKDQVARIAKKALSLLEN